MAVVSLVQLFLLLLVVKSECTVEILKTMGTPKIQFVSVKATYDQDTSSTLYSVILSGPFDTEEIYRSSYGPHNSFTEVSSNGNFSVFKTEIKVPTEKFFDLMFRSASTSEELSMLVRAGDMSGLQEHFLGQNCRLELKKETDERITKYSVRKEDLCDIDVSDEEFEAGEYYVSTDFDVDFKDKQGHELIWLDNPWEKYDIIETETTLTLNDEKMKEDGVQYEAYIEIYVEMDWPISEVASYRYFVNFV